jgi:hypothetical protein
MSKTYNERHQLKKVKPKYEFPQGYNTLYWGEIKPGETKSYDYSGTTDENNYGKREITRMSCRHPNKKRNRKLLKEFKITGVDYFGNSIIGFDHRCGDINLRRERKSIMRIGNEKRRFKLKKQADKLIEEGINEYNRENY